ncbi:MAG TPA: hypothetical protein VKD72_28975 [Gemmataceae bacterium]|nr:hypothetical protein [Gemmataceae bacterium]
MPPTYLRFTPEEFRAIERACRVLPLRDDSFPAFRRSLAAAVAPHSVELATRVARFHSYQAGILFEYLREQRGLCRRPQ